MSATFTAPKLTATMQADARAIGEAKIAITAAKGKAKVSAMDVFRAACRASRERHGEDLHNVVMGAAIAGATGGRA